MDKRVVAIIVTVCVLFLGLGVALGSNFGKNTAPDTTGQTKKVEVEAGDWIKGKNDAAVTIIEYGDFQCPACAAYAPIVDKLVSDLPDKVRIVWRNFPLTSVHRNAWGAALAAEAAGEQGKFWQMHEQLFGDHGAWVDEGDPQKKFVEYAQKIGVDVEKFKVDMKSNKVQQAVQKDADNANSLGLRGTPSFFVNGVFVELPGSYDGFKKLIESEAAKVTPSEKVHMHFDVAVYVNGKKLDLSGDKYMEKNEAVHLHDSNGEVAHIHKRGATLGMFIDPLELKATGEVTVSVNGKVVDGDWKAYLLADLDRVVVMYGKTVSSPKVTDKACIYSEKCPERGKPPTENCVGGLNTPCE